MGDFLIQVAVTVLIMVVIFIFGAAGAETRLK